MAVCLVHFHHWNTQKDLTEFIIFVISNDSKRFLCCHHNNTLAQTCCCLWYTVIILIHTPSVYLAGSVKHFMATPALLHQIHRTVEQRHLMSNALIAERPKVWPKPDPGVFLIIYWELVKHIYAFHNDTFCQKQYT